MCHRLGLALLLSFAVPLLSGCAGQRYVDVQIERDGVPTLKAGYGVSDSLAPAAIWDTLQGQSFEAVGEIKPEPTDPQKAVLKGKIRIAILHVNNEIATAKINELRLIRDAKSADRWKLATGEVQRTAQAAGL